MSHNLTDLLDVRIYTGALIASTHTLDEIAHVERVWGKVYLGSTDDGTCYVPVFRDKGAKDEEEHA